MQNLAKIHAQESFTEKSCIYIGNAKSKSKVEMKYHQGKYFFGETFLIEHV